MHIYRCEITLMEATFFSSREVSNIYYTEPLIGNYALAYAMGFAQAPYFIDGSINYVTDLGKLNQEGVYVTPATIIGEPRFTLGQFNAQADAYWYAFANNVIVTRPDGAWTDKNGAAWYIQWKNGQRQKVGLENRPQHGVIRYLAIGNRASAYVLSLEPQKIPAYIRLGKFMSKARIDTSELQVKSINADNIRLDFLLNPADLPPEYILTSFDLISVPPTPLIRNARLSGEFYALPNQIHLPVGMRFGI